MSYRTADDIRNDAITLIDNRGSGIRTEAGEPIVDLVDAFSIEGANENIVAQYLQAINSIAGWQSIVDDDTFKIQLAEALGISATTLNQDFARRIGAPTDLSSDIEAQLFVDLNRFALSQGRPRSNGNFATTTITLYLTTGDPYTLARGATVKTNGSGGTGILYDTTTDLVGVVPAFSPARNLYYVSVSAQCRNIGTKGNQIAGAINQALNPISNVVDIKNLIPAEGGLDRESNDSLLDSLTSALTGTNINTIQGIINYLVKQDTVFDVALIGPGDPLVVRATAGAVDAYIIGSVLQTDTVDVRVNVTGEQVTLPYQPVRSIDSVVGAQVYSDGGGYTTPSNQSAFDFSAIKATPDLTWSLPPTGPSATEVVTVTFTYNSLIRQLQRQFDEDPAVHVPGADILIKEGTRVGVFVEAKVVILPSNSQPTVEGAVLNALQDELNSYKFKRLVSFSQLLAVMQKTKINGLLVVDRIDGFKIGTSLGGLGTDDIVIVGNAYARLSQITFISP